MRSPKRDTLGYVIGQFRPKTLESGEGSPSRYLVLWHGESEPSVEQSQDQFVAGSISWAVEVLAADWSLQAAKNPRKTFLEILAEESLIQTAGNSAVSLVSSSRVQRRWKTVMGKNRPSEEYDEVVKGLASEKIVSGTPGLALIKLVTEPKDLFKLVGDQTWWSEEPAKSTITKFDYAVPLLTAEFYDWHVQLQNHVVIERDYDAFTKFCELTEAVLSGQSIERDGISLASKVFSTYIESLQAPARDLAIKALGLVWGEVEGVNLDAQKTFNFIQKVEVSKIRESRFQSAMVRYLLTRESVSALSESQIVSVASLARESHLAVNFQNQLESALNTISSDSWKKMLKASGEQVTGLLGFFGVQSEFGQKMLRDFLGSAEELFASQSFWSSLTDIELNSQSISQLARPAVSKVLGPIVIPLLKARLKSSNFMEVSIAFSSREISRAFSASDWSEFFTNGLHSEGSILGSEILELISNRHEVEKLALQVQTLSTSVDDLSLQNRELLASLDNAKVEVSNLVSQLEQTRAGMKSSVDSQSEQQSRDIVRGLAKLLVIAGSLPDKVAPDVYRQMVQQVKSVGLVPIGAAGESAEFNPTVHIMSLGTQVTVGENVKVIAPGFELKSHNGGEVIWKAQVVLT